ncbi:MAG: AAA family ATPase [Spirochaetaceae bacterium]|nr:AAA family ATPase [Spirochaetaceae bacterium]
MAKILTFFNHKGGVGKTTSSYNVAWALSELGKHVLMIDADAQCNLTEISVEDSVIYGPDKQFLFNSESNYDTNFILKNNIYEYLVSYVQPTPGKELPKIKFFKKKEAKNLELLLGSVKFAELEKTISLSLANVPGLNHIPMSVYTALKKVGSDFDFIILDLSPALSATNQLFLMLSDYFIVPANPSVFSRQALMNLNTIFRGWNRELAGFEVFNNKLKALPKLLGIVCQNYRPYSRANEKGTTSAKRFEETMIELNNYAHNLARDLNGFGMALTVDEFKKYFTKAQPYRIADIPDFNQLMVVSEKEKLPVIALDNKILNRNDLGTEQYRTKVEDFKKEYYFIAEGIASL